MQAINSTSSCLKDPCLFNDSYLLSFVYCCADTISVFLLALQHMVLMLHSAISIINYMGCAITMVLLSVQDLRRVMSSQYDF